MGKLALALALADLAAHGVKAGQILEAEQKTIENLRAEGQADPHKDAVAYAKSQNAPVIRSALETAAAAKQAEMDELRVEIAKLEPLIANADEATKTALQRDLDAKRTALAALEK